MRWIAVFLALNVLASCGVDGAPIRPSATATVGVGTSGVTLGGKASVGKGPVSISVGL